MPSINGISLPTVEVKVGNMDCDQIAAKLADEKMPMEAMIEIAIFLKREREKAEAIKVIEDVMRGRIDKLYEKLPKDSRETRRTEVGMITYTEEGEKIELRDRDFTVENLTQEQLRITYKPDLKALETILKPKDFERHIKRSKKPASTTLRDIKGSSDYQELDF